MAVPYHGRCQRAARRSRSMKGEDLPGNGGKPTQDVETVVIRFAGETAAFTLVRPCDVEFPTGAASAQGSDDRVAVELSNST